jgi:hypothetical protein
MTLAGFSRGTSLNIYAGQERVTLAASIKAEDAAARVAG